MTKNRLVRGRVIIIGNSLTKLRPSLADGEESQQCKAEHAADKDLGKSHLESRRCRQLNPARTFNVLMYTATYGALCGVMWASTGYVLTTNGFLQLIVSQNRSDNTIVLFSANKRNKVRTSLVHAGTCSVKLCCPSARCARAGHPRSHYGRHFRNACLSLFQFSCIALRNLQDTTTLYHCAEAG